MKRNEHGKKSNWRPNWMTLSNYPDPKITTMKEWAWEFLRRNRSYQGKYIKLQNAINKTKYGAGWFTALMQYSEEQQRADGTHELLNEIMGILTLCREKYCVGCTKGGLPDPTLPYKKAGTGFVNEDFVRFYDEQKRTRPKGIYFDDDPWIEDKEQATAIIEEMNEDTCKKNQKRAFELSISPKKLLVEISLEGNLTKQLSIIKQVARAQQKKLQAWGVIQKSSKQRDYYPLYLRLLDALEEMKPNELKKQWKVFYPNDRNDSLEKEAEKKLNENIKMAIALCSQGYLKLVRLPED